MVIFFMVYVFLLGFLYREYKRQKIWERAFNKVGGDKHWHAWMFFGLTLVNLNIVLFHNWYFWLPFVFGEILGIAKEYWDAKHGKFFDFNDLKANNIGMVLAYITHYWYLSVSLWLSLRG